MSIYTPHKPARTRFLPIRNLQYHVREWGEPGQPLLVLLHGWMDVGASFQFVVDALARDWHVVAPDWRGFGLTESSQDAFWMPDYQADLDALLRVYSPDVPIDLVGHSMGGNVATLYAGYRPERVRRLVNLEGLGMPGRRPDEAPVRMTEWLDALANPPTLSTYDGYPAVARRLMKTNPRLAPEHAHWLAAHWSRPRADGRYELLGSPAHKIVNPYIYRVEEAVAAWARITAPVLWVMAAESEHKQRVATWPDYAQRLAVIRNLTQCEVTGAGHMLHHDQPEQVARLIEDFFTPL